MLLSGRFISRMGLFSALKKQSFVSMQICLFIAAECERMEEVSKEEELLELNY
jgi:hypothetical protein